MRCQVENSKDYDKIKWTLKKPSKTRGDKNQIKKPMSPTSMNTQLFIRF